MRLLRTLMLALPLALGAGAALAGGAPAGEAVQVGHYGHPGYGYGHGYGPGYGRPYYSPPPPRYWRPSPVYRPYYPPPPPPRWHRRHWHRHGW